MNNLLIVRRRPCDGVKMCAVLSVTTLFRTDKKSIDACITEKNILLLQLAHALAKWFISGRALKMEGDGLVLCLTLNTITQNQPRTLCQAK